MRTFATATAVAALLVAAPAMAQQSQPAPQQQQAQSDQQQGDQQKQQVSRQDQQFAKDAAAGNMLEVRLGEIAGDQAEDQQVKDLAKRMVDDHQSASDTLMQTARSLNIDIPQSLPDEEQQTLNRFEQMQGQEFDREYIRFMVEDHDKEVDAYRTQAEQGQNQDLKQYAEDTLPTLEEHLKQARQIGQQMGVSMAQADQQQQQQERTQVTVDQAPADVAVDQPSPEVTVVDPEPQVSVRMPDPDVQVSQPEPEVNVQQAQPQVDIEKEGQADVTIVERDTRQADQPQAPQRETEQDRPAEQTAERAGESVQETGRETDQAMRQAGEQTEQTDRDRQRQQQLGDLQNVVGEPVYGQAGEQVGDVSEVLFDNQGNAERLIIDRGGFLGIGEKTVAIDMQNITMSEQGIQVNLTDQQIAEMPEYEEAQ